MLSGSRGGPQHRGIVPPACGSLRLRGWRQHLKSSGCCEPSPCIALQSPALRHAPASPGYSHVGLGGVGQGDAEVGNVLEDTKERGETRALWSGCHACLQPVWQHLCLLTPVLPVGLQSPNTASPCVGMEPHSPLAGGGQWGTGGSWEGVGNKMRLESWKLFPIRIPGQVIVTRWPVSRARGAAQLLWDH